MGTKKSSFSERLASMVKQELEGVGGLQAEAGADVDLDISALDVIETIVTSGARAVAVLAAARLHQNTMSWAAEEVIQTAQILTDFILDDKPEEE